MQNLSFERRHGTGAVDFGCLLQHTRQRLNLLADLYDISRRLHTDGNMAPFPPMLSEMLKISLIIGVTPLIPRLSIDE